MCVRESVCNVYVWTGCALCQVNVNSVCLCDCCPLHQTRSGEWKVGTVRTETGRLIWLGSVWWKEQRKSGWMGMVRVKVSGRWRGNVLSLLSESFSCWQTRLWPFPSQTMNLLYFPAPAPFLQAVCVRVCVCLLVVNMWPASCLSMCCAHIRYNIETTLNL